MKIIMIKNFWRSGKIELEAGKEYSTPGDISEKFATALIDSGKARAKPGRKKRDANG